ncbi:tripartite tricarboxylate transporter TctB family protein [Paracoccaceae bacterium GXU_MW_L88]
MRVSERNSDIWIGAGLLVFCALTAWRTTYIGSGFSTSFTGPSFIPWLMIAFLFCLAILLILRALKRPAGDDNIEMPSRATLLAMGAFAVLMFAYAAAFMPLGYLPATLATFIIGLLLLGERNWLIVILFPIAMTAVVYFGFTRFLGVWLP